MHVFYNLLIGFAGFLTFKLANYGVYGKKNIKSPEKFNFNYWISQRNNWNDIVLGLILFVVILRYKNDLFLAFKGNFLVDFLEPFKDSELFIYAIGLLMTFIIMLLRILLKLVFNKTKALSKSNKQDKE